MREFSGQIYPMSAPTLGWIDRIPLPKMPEDSAVTLINFFPTTTGVKKRNGFERMTETPFTSACDTIMSFNKSDGTKVLLAAGDNTIQSINLSTFAKTDVSAAATITNDRWQYVQFYDSIFVANGVDRVHSWNGTGNFAAAGFTIGGAPDDDLVAPFIYKERLYFVKGASVWYGNPRQVTGALTEYDFSYILTKGGKLLFGGSSTFDIGEDSKEVFIVASDQGEVLVFAGSYPGDPNTWGIQGHYYLGQPFGPRSFCNMGGELQVITELGVYPISQVLSGAANRDETGRQVRASENIDNAFTGAAKYFFSLFGWDGLFYPRGNMFIVNVPLNSESSIQYVMNTLTGAWCKFEGMAATSWCVSDRYAYFGGFDGHVYRFDTVQNDGVFSTDDTGVGVNVHGETAFTWCGDETMNKEYLLVRAITSSTSEAALTLGINTNFQRGALESPIELEGAAAALWDVAEWDVDEWSDLETVNLDWKAVAGAGLNMNLVFSGTLKDIDLEILGFHIQYKPGGAL